MTLNSSVVVLSMTLNSIGASKEWFSVSELQFVLPQLIVFVWSYLTCSCVAGLRAVSVGCSCIFRIKSVSILCHLWTSVKGIDQIFDDDADDGDGRIWRTRTFNPCWRHEGPAESSWCGRFMHSSRLMSWESWNERLGTLVCRQWQLSQLILRGCAFWTAAGQLEKHMWCSSVLNIRVNLIWEHICGGGCVFWRAAGQLWCSSVCSGELWINCGVHRFWTPRQTSVVVGCCGRRRQRKTSAAVVVRSGQRETPLMDSRVPLEGLSLHSPPQH